MSYRIPNPVGVCQQLYGIENVNDVRDCVMNSIRRFYGPFCDFHEQNLYEIIQSYLVKILEDAGRNSKAVKLAIPPAILEPNFFVQNYVNSGYNAEKAYQMCIQQHKENSVYLRNCYIDYNAIK